MSDRHTTFDTAASLDDVRSVLEEALAARPDLTLHFLMRRWNGRAATYNLGWRDVYARRGYRLLGRLKMRALPGRNTRITLSAPTLCDPRPAPAESATFQGFVHDVRERLQRRNREPQRSQ